MDVVRRKKASRQENAERTQEALVEAALRSIHRYGYGKASVSRITEEAGVSQGTLYSYFGSHQSLLAQLLPLEGKRLLDTLGDHGSGPGGYFENERFRFVNLLRYLDGRPYILSLLIEAEVAAPAGFAQYMREIEKRYLVVFRQALRAGEIRQFSARGFQVIAEVLAGCRAQIAMHQHFRSEPRSELRRYHESLAVGAFIKFIDHGLQCAPPNLKGRRRYIIEVGAPESTAKVQLFEAAGEEISAVGFANMSIKAVTSRAGVAVGTFYTCFPGRDEFLLELIRYGRRLMTHHVRLATRGCTSFAESEARGLQAYFELLHAKPWLQRLTAEAAVWARPEYRRTFAAMCYVYQKRLRAAKAAGEFGGFEDDELLVVGAIFTAARHYLASRYIRDSTTMAPNWVVKTYVEFICGGLRAT